MPCPPPHTCTVPHGRQSTLGAVPSPTLLSCSGMHTGLTPAHTARAVSTACFTAALQQHRDPHKHLRGMCRPARLTVRAFEGAVPLALALRAPPLVAGGVVAALAFGGHPGPGSCRRRVLRLCGGHQLAAQQDRVLPAGAQGTISMPELWLASNWTCGRVLSLKLWPPC